MSAVEKAPTPEELLAARLAAATERRKLQTEGRALAVLEQQVADEEKLAELEAAYPDGFAIVYLNAPISGKPGFVAARDCTGPEYTRYKAGLKVRVVNKSAEVDGGDAGAAQLGRVCLIYPDPDVFKAMCDQRSGLEAGLGQDVVSRAQTRKAEEAKK